MTAEHQCIDTGRVVRVTMRATYVTVDRTAACDGCKACVFGKKTAINLPAVNHVGAKEGDAVRISMERDAKSSLLSVAIGLGIPLVCMIIGLVVSFYTGLVEWACVLIGLGCSIVGLFVTIPFDRKLMHTRYGCRITEVIPPPADDTIITQE